MAWVRVGVRVTVKVRFKVIKRVLSSTVCWAVRIGGTFPLGAFGLGRLYREEESLALSKIVTFEP